MVVPRIITPSAVHPEPEIHVHPERDHEQQIDQDKQQRAAWMLGLSTVVHRPSAVACPLSRKWMCHHEAKLPWLVEASGYSCQTLLLPWIRVKAKIGSPSAYPRRSQPETAISGPRCLWGPAFWSRDSRAVGAQECLGRHMRRSGQLGAHGRVIEVALLEAYHILAGH